VKHFALLSLLALASCATGYQPQSFTGGFSDNALCNTTVGVSVGTWNHVLAVFASSTSRSVYLNGANKGTDATSTPGALTNSRIGATTSAASFFLGAIAYVTVRNVALSDADALALYNNGLGTHPRNIHPEAIVSFARLNGPGNLADDVSGTWTPTAAPTLVAEPFAIDQMASSTMSIVQMPTPPFNFWVYDNANLIEPVKFRTLAEANAFVASGRLTQPGMMRSDGGPADGLVLHSPR
jgi:hypothetical protein